MNRASKAIRNGQEDAFRQNAFRTGAKSKVPCNLPEGKLQSGKERKRKV
jgi:hypothetical protein